MGDRHGGGTSGRRRRGSADAFGKADTLLDGLSACGAKPGSGGGRIVGAHEEYASRFSEVFASVTADDGTEFGEPSDLEAWGTRVYFAHPNERHNALLRRFLPKGTALESYTSDELFLIADEINRLPRRQLAYRTPDELFENELDNIYAIQHAKLTPTDCSICNCN